MTFQAVLNRSATAVVIDTAGHILGGGQAYQYDDATISAANFAIIQAHINNGRLILLTGGVNIPPPTQGASYVGVAVSGNSLVFTDNLGGTTSVTLPSGSGGGGPVTSASITDATTVGKALLTSTDATAAKTTLSLTKADVGLNNVNNTADANKPISSATQTALDALTTAQSGFVKASDLTQATDLVTTSSLSTTLTGYAQTSALSNYATTSALGGKADNTALTNALSRIAALEASGGITPSQRGATPATTAPTSWLRADQISGVSDGAAVGTWPAAAGNAATTVTANSGTPPTYVAAATAIKSQPAVRFSSATRTKMLIPNPSVAVARNSSFFLVVNARTLGSAWNLLTGVTSADTGGALGTRLQTLTTGAVSAQQFASSSPAAPAVTSAGAVAANAWFILSVVYLTTANGATPNVWVNGIAGSGGVGDTATTPATLAGLALGGYGAGAGDLDYAEVVAIPSALSDTDRKLWESYLSKVYGITVAA